MHTWVTRGGRNSNLVIFCLAAVLWSLWSTRNIYAIEGVFPKHSTDILYKIITYMQKWRALLKEGEKEMLDPRIETMKRWTVDLALKCNNRIEADDFM